MNKILYFAKYLIPFLITYYVGRFVLNMQVVWAGCDCPENDAQSFVIMCGALVASVLSALLTYFFSRKMNFLTAILVSVLLSILLLNIILSGNISSLKNQALPYFQK